MDWIIRIIPEILAVIIAYITNPVIVLFCDDDGVLPSWAWPWATYDNLSCDIRWMVTDHCVPSFAEYDYDKHYVYFPEDGDTPGYAVCINYKFTLIERLKRYICRLAWLYRNCAYGFSYYVNGCFISRESDILFVKNEKGVDNYQYILCYDHTMNILVRPWCIYYKKKWCKYFLLRVYLGWKLKEGRSGRRMLVLYVNPFRLCK